MAEVNALPALLLAEAEAVQTRGCAEEAAQELRGSPPVSLHRRH